MSFPDIHIYPFPYLKGYIKLETKNEQLHYAIAYLQVKNVQNILLNMSNDEFIDYIMNADYISLHQKNSLLLRDILYTSYQRKHYKLYFHVIEDLLYKKKYFF